MKIQLLCLTGETKLYKGEITAKTLRTLLKLWTGTNILRVSDQNGISLLYIMLLTYTMLARNPRYGLNWIYLVISYEVRNELRQLYVLSRERRYRANLQSHSVTLHWLWANQVLVTNPMILSRQQSGRIAMRVEYQFLSHRYDWTGDGRDQTLIPCTWGGCLITRPLSAALLAWGVKASILRAADLGSDSRLWRFPAFESNQWFKNWHSIGYTARRLVL